MEFLSFYDITDIIFGHDGPLILDDSSFSGNEIKSLSAIETYLVVG